MKKFSIWKYVLVREPASPGNSVESRFTSFCLFAIAVWSLPHLVTVSCRIGLIHIVKSLSFVNIAGWCLCCVQVRQTSDSGAKDKKLSKLSLQHEVSWITLTFKVNNCPALKSLPIYGKEAENRWVVSLVLNDVRQLDDVTSKFLLRRRGTLGCWS